MKRIANGFYIQQEKNGTFTYFVRDGRWWRVSKFWYNQFTAEKQKTVTELARANRNIYPTLKAAISAAKGNRAS